MAKYLLVKRYHSLERLESTGDAGKTVSSEFNLVSETELDVKQPESVCRRDNKLFNGKSSMETVSCGGSYYTTVVQSAPHGDDGHHPDHQRKM